MTICISALCDGGKSCVVAADRQITAHALSLEFEARERKIEPLVNSCVVMAAGDALLAAEVVERTRPRVGALGNATLQQMAEALRNTYMTVHLERVESVILHPRGLTFKEFKERAQQLPLQAYLNIDQLIFGFGLNVVEFLVTGVDSTGAHIFRVHYNGMAGGSWLEWCDKLGYRAVGTGASHATILLSLGGQHRGLSAADTVYNVYVAKKNAEVAPGVGSATDLGVVTKDGFELIGDELLGKLETLRLESQKQTVTPEAWRKAYDEGRARTGQSSL